MTTVPRAQWRRSKLGRWSGNLLLVRLATLRPRAHLFDEDVSDKIIIGVSVKDADDLVGLDPDGHSLERKDQAGEVSST